jgi:YD repeat-containing protein
VLDRLVRTESSSGIVVTHTYDAVGNRLTTTDPAGTTTWAYDALGRVTSEALVGGATLGYTWDPAGNLAAFTDPSGTVAYTHDPINRVVSVTDPGSGAPGVTPVGHRAGLLPA